MLYTSINFNIYVTVFDTASYRLESTLLLFHNNAPVFLYLFRVKTAQQSQTRCLSLVQFWTCLWAVQDWPVFVTSSFLMLGGSFERKSSSEDRKAINMENLGLKQDFRSLQNENPVSGVLSVQSVSPQYVCTLVLQHQGKWMSFSMELMTLIKPYCSM